MTPKRADDLFKPFRQSFFIKAIPFPFGAIYRLWTFSIRFEYGEEDGLKELSESNVPIVFFLWHNRLFLAGEWHRRFRKNTTCYGLISASRDGAWLETFYGFAGIRPIRGSRNRRSRQSIRELIRVSRSGNDVGITPDGSRGPIYKAKPGAILLARITKSPICLLSFKYSIHKFGTDLLFHFHFQRSKCIQKYFLQMFYSRKDVTTKPQIAESGLMKITLD